MKKFVYAFFVVAGIFAASFLPAQTDNQQPVNPNGYNKFYYENGKISSEGPMRDGKPDGYWKTYYQNGKIKSEGNRKNFQLDSTWKFYSEQGKLTFEYTYKDGKKTGPLRTYNSAGHLTVEETYVSNMKQGPAKEFYESGKLQKITPFIEGREEGTGYEYDTAGTIITITQYKAGFIKNTERINRTDINGLKQGVWKDFWPNGKVKNEGRYVNGVKDGYFKEYNEFGNLVNVTKWSMGQLVKNPPELAKIETKTTYYPNGKVKVVGNYKDGIPEGVFRMYDTTGVITSAEVYQDGILVGEGIYDAKGLQQGHWKEYYAETGELKGEGDYKDGVRVGDWKFYYSNKQIDQVGKYDQKGRPVGTWKWYYESGQLLREEVYSEGLRNGVMTEYDENGNIITQGEYIDGQKEGHWFFQMDDYREEGDYVAGERNGVWKHTYTPSGKQRFEGSFVNGVPDGKQTWWHENGRIWQEGRYVYGRKEGDWKYFDEDGIITLTITYKDDVEIKFDGARVKLEEINDNDNPQPAPGNN